ncbi:General secretion pathway protein M [Oceanithermus profundus DSM 14977]|uniref:General secretion pathway protein M n=1 Tax=Oceanithermus profundus (strain DSM 14977 / NBRC 100410 / VKM B-2274 / 506) TaxID=670487 RepID=E4U916_OCEP5|nr:type 4a pilus biogenesis protein PilO [Oceanithermus profundus]ADR36846.1 General secretion pathway protein M [Oceanithermus profundus DSM 14977]
MLAKIGQREIAIIVIVLSLLAAGAWYFTWYTGAQTHIQELQDEIGRLEIQKQRGLAARRAQPQLEATIRDYEAQIAEFLKALPPREEFASVLDALSERANATGVTLRSISRSPAGSPVEDVRAVNVTLSLESPFPELFVFLKRLETMRRFSTIDGLAMTIGDAETTNPTLSTNLTMTVYVYEGTPPTDVQEGGAGQ